MPFGIREGKPHWKASLHSPIHTPRPEDILVFNLSSKSQEWKHIKLVSGSSNPVNHYNFSDGKIFIHYPGLQAEIRGTDGILEKLLVKGETINLEPLQVGFMPVSSSDSTLNSGKLKTIPFKTQLVSHSSNGAFTELNFVLHPQKGPSMGLTYRFYASGCSEILLDERPWEKPSHWLNYKVAISFPLKGTPEGLQYLKTHAPYYGFKDYAAVVDTPANLYVHQNGGIIEVGEEFANGRLWHRKLFPIAQEHCKKSQDLADLVDEGFILSVIPSVRSIDGKTVTIHTEPETPEVSRTILTMLDDSLKKTKYRSRFQHTRGYCEISSSDIRNRPNCIHDIRRRL